MIAGSLSSTATARTWKDDIGGHLQRGLAEWPTTESLVLSGRGPVTRPVGLMKGTSFFRTPVGKGWALVGDAGLHKDPTPGYGITDALRDAKALSRAMLDGREAALDVYWRERDVHSVPLYANAKAMGSLGYANPFNELVLCHRRRT